MKIMKYIVITGLMLLLVGCGATVGLGAKTSTSTFDGSRSVSIEPHGTNCGMSMVCSSLGAEWNSRLKDQAMLVVECMGDYSSIDAASLNIDGEIIPLQSRVLTDYSNNMADSGANHSAAMDQLTRTSTRRYSVPLSLINRIAAAHSVKLRVVTSQVTIDSVVIDGSKDSKAYHALGRFLAQVAQTSS